MDILLLDKVTYKHRFESLDMEKIGGKIISTASGCIEDQCHLMDSSEVLCRQHLLQAMLKDEVP
jgi:hypothetical protein